MLKMLKDIVKFVSCLVPASVTGTTAATGVNVADFGSLTFLVHVGAAAAGMDSGSNKFDIVIQHSDVDTDGSYAECGADDFLVGTGVAGETPASGIAKALDGGTADTSQVYAVHYRGIKKFARIRLVKTGTASAPMSVVAVAGHLKHAPPA